MLSIGDGKPRAMKRKVTNTKIILFNTRHAKELGSKRRIRKAEHTGWRLKLSRSGKPTWYVNCVATS